ncbi:MAG: phosphoenolpyruvate carboxykinase (ATP), partial [Candidatus Neomarinimicrobiota bacterium]
MITAKSLGLDQLGLTGVVRIERNLPLESLIEDSILHKQGKLGMKGVVMVDTGRYTGRSPKDKYFVREPSSEDHIWWGPVNQPISEEIFDELYRKVVSYYNHASDSNTYVFDGFAGADPDYRIPIRILAKRAWQAHFCHNMFIRPTEEELADFTPEFTILNASPVYNEKYEKHGMHSETFILFHLGRKLILIGGTEYGGKMKKGIFS